jgi:hypothetical protein
VGDALGTSGTSAYASCNWLNLWGQSDKRSSESLGVLHRTVLVAWGVDNGGVCNSQLVQFNSVCLFNVDEYEQPASFSC